MPSEIRAGETRPRSGRHPIVRALTAKNTLAGLMFIVIAATALWISREYPVGTLRRMGSGFLPQALCWLLIGLGAIVMVQGLFARDRSAEDASEDREGLPRENLWSIVLVAASLVAFALTIERFGLIVAIACLVAIASFAYRGLKWWETLATAVFMAVLCWSVFVLGLGISVKVLPELG